MTRVLTFDFCEMMVYDKYIIVVVKEGINIEPKHNDVLLEVSSTHFKNKPFVYIANRIHSYSVDPKIYYETNKISNLMGLAVVSHNYKAKNNAEIEKLFFKKPLETFSKIEDAIDWANKMTE